MVTRRLASVLLATLVGAILVAVPAHGVPVTQTIGDFTYQVDDENVAAGATITASTATGPSVVVPGSVEINGITYAVRQVYTDVFRNRGLTSVVVSEGVEYIQPYAFADNAITSVTLPSTLTWMNTGAFANNNLASVDLPENLSSIGPGAFFDNALTSVTIPASVTTISAQAFNSNPGLSGITFEGNAPLLSQALALGPATTPIYFYADATGFTTPTWSGGGSTVYSPIEIVLVTVSFDANGHGTAPTSTTVRPGNTVADPGALSATGYAFSGWFTAASGGTEVTFPYTATANVTLYAQWDVNEYTVTFEPGNGDSATTQTVEYNETATAPFAPTRVGHSFNGWFTAASGGTEVTFPYTVTEDVTFYAQWEIHDYTVTFEPANGDAAISQTVDYNDTVVAPSAPSLVSHSFLGWFTAASGGTQVTFPYTVTGDTTLYAQWERVAAKVTAPAQAAAGSTITVTGESFIPGETVQVWLLSTPVQIGTATVGTDGTFTVNAAIPANVTAGSHSVEVRGSVTSAVASPITITSVLAQTGANPTGTAWAAIATLMTGLGLLLLGRRTATLARLT